MPPGSRLLRELVSRGLVTEEQVGEARRMGAARGEGPESALVSARLVREEDLLRLQAQLGGAPYLEEIPAEDGGGGSRLAALVPLAFARRHRLFPFRDPATGKALVALSRPAERETVENLEAFLGEEVGAAYASPRAVEEAINRSYQPASESAQEVIGGLEEGDLAHLAGDLDEPQDLLDASEEAPVIRFVNAILYQAVKDRASDIHIEPFERELSVRYRIDGVLHSVLTPPRRLHAAIVSRVKVMASLDIAERRLPQDGRIRLKIAGRDIDIRVSVVPTSFGERVVMRLLDRSQVLLGMDEIGMAPDHLRAMEKLVRTSHGIILVTGPTGSGKTTTLYAALSRINSSDKNIITVEDPVEYQLRGISQIQVNPKIDLTFANGLRSILRQDPNVIMVGEVRDLTTAEIAIQASLTGHLVFSTLHTNDAAGAITRLVDMGIEPFLVASSLTAILAQRLVRRICPDCREQYPPLAEELADLGLDRGKVPAGGLWRGRGCAACLGTGYLGRTGIYELIRVTEEIKASVMKSPDSGTIQRIALREGMRALRGDGALKVLAGTTTVEEVLRVTREEAGDVAV
jgi:general secretion pathway protein E